MKKDPVLNLMVTGLLVAIVAIMGLCYWHLRSTRELRMLQAQAPQVARARALMQALLTDLSEYRSHNQTIDPILSSAGLKLNAPPATPKGGSK